MSHKIVFLDRETLDANLRKPNFPHEYKEYAQTSPSEIVERLKGADICISNKVPLREDTLKHLPDLSLIHIYRPSFRSAAGHDQGAIPAHRGD